ncbi:MAG: hypothetical protein ABJP06_00225 [Sulfitobacter sp.]
MSKMTGEATSLDAISVEFESFINLNPTVELATIEGDDARYEFRFDMPWGDKTLAVFLPRSSEERIELATALSELILPTQFSAVYHIKTNKLEVLWTAYKLRAASEEVKDRVFDFNWMGTIRSSRFARSSDVVLCLAKHCLPISNESLTGHRNILPFHFYATEIEHPSLNEPMSFWIDCDGLEMDDLKTYVRHLNAHMTYFDRSSPRVLIHEEIGSGFQRRSRYVEGEFPAVINAREVDANLLAFWNEIFESNNEIMRFLLCYRIVEYAAFNYLDAKTKKEVMRLLSQPSLPQNVASVSGTLLEIFMQSKETEQIPRLQNLVSETVDLKRVWEVISINSDYFRKPHVFEGGYTISPLLSGKCDFETWKPNGVRTTMDRLRQIRNALSHGQDGATRGTIQPTIGNSQSLVPWVNLIEILAGDVMLLHKE